MYADTTLAMVQKLQEQIASVVSDMGKRHHSPSINSADTVNLICGSSRCGSSWLFRFLSQSPHLATPRGEQVPFEKLYLFPQLTNRVSDELGAQDLHPDLARNVWQLLAMDLGTGSTMDEATEAEAYDVQLQVRLPLQFPRTLTPDIVKRALRDCPQRGQRFSELVRHLARQDLIRAEYYDRDPQLGWTGERTPEGPPDLHVVLEEPPFIPILPRARPQQGRPLHLLLKSSLHAYRLPFLRAMFSQTKMRLILLTRNPAASINGLIEGWLSRGGFYSYDLSLVGITLHISGYSDLFVWGRRWWKFDLPAVDAALFSAPLEQVCAQQWTCAYASVLAFLDQHPEVERFTLKYEDLIQGPERRRLALDKLALFLGIPQLDPGDGEIPDGVVMATRPPQPGRWRQRYRQIVRVLQDASLRRVCERLGYDPKEPNQWI